MISHDLSVKTPLFSELETLGNIKLETVLVIFLIILKYIKNNKYFTMKNELTTNHEKLLKCISVKALLNTSHTSQLPSFNVSVNL